MDFEVSIKMLDTDRGFLNLPLVSREWKNGSSSYNCTPFPHSLLTKGKLRARKAFRLITCRGFGAFFGLGLGMKMLGVGFRA